MTQKQIMLSSGEMLTSDEIFEGFVELARQTSAFPLLSRDDLLKALVNLTFETLDWWDTEDRE